MKDEVGHGVAVSFLFGQPCHFEGAERLRNLWHIIGEDFSLSLEMTIIGWWKRFGEKKAVYAVSTVS